MRTYRPKVGPFKEQPFYTMADIEAMCADELLKLNLYPPSPAPIRIDRFVEKRFGVQPRYEDLPDGLLGYTTFGTQGVERIVVAKALDEDGTKPAERRLRTTLAHECGHGLLHAHLFVFGSRPYSLFGDRLGPDDPQILCREGGVSGVGDPTKKPPYRWWEYQANQVMGELLLPKGLVQQALAPFLSSRGALGLQYLPAGHRELAFKSLSEAFDVNPIVARIRLEVLYPPTAEHQLTL